MFSALRPIEMPGTLHTATCFYARIKKSCELRATGCGRKAEIAEKCGGFHGGTKIEHLQKTFNRMEVMTHPPADAVQQLGNGTPIDVSLTINGQPRTVTTLPWVSLLDTLREQLALTGTKKGCDHGQCGACTVLRNDKRILSCLTLTVANAGASITTVEGLAQGDVLHPLQEAFIEHDAFQCGYCTPGQLCSAVGLLKEGKAETEEEVKELMSGNLCRCGANVGIISAIMDVKSRTHE